MCINKKDGFNALSDPLLDDKIKTKDIGKLITEVSGKVQSLLEHSFVLDINNKDFSDIKKIVLIMFEGLLNNQDKESPLLPYFNGDEINKEYLNDKVNKNIILFLESIISSIENKLLLLNKGNKEKNNINSRESKRIIFSIFHKGLKIIHIFGTNLSPDLFSDLLELDLKDIKNIKNNFDETINELSSFEVSENIKINTNKNQKNTFLNDLYFNSSYRVSYRKANGEYYKEMRALIKKIKNKEKKGDKLSEKELLDLKNWKEELNILKLEGDNIINKKLAYFIEEEIYILYNKIYELFIKTIELKTNLESRLLKVMQGFDKIFGYIEYLRGTGIILKDFNANKTDTMYFNKLTNRLLKSEGTNKGFDNNDSKNMLFLSFLNDYKENSDSIIKEIGYLIEEQTSYSCEYKKIKGINVDIKKITYDEWSNLDIDCTYKIFIENMLKGGLDDNISLNGLSLPRGNSRKIFLHVFSNVKKIDSNIALNQLSKIESLVSKGISINELIEDNINHLQFLYEIWLFKISIRKRTKPLNKNTKINIDYDKSHGLIDIITHKIKEGSNLEGVDYNPKGRLYNMSEENIGDYLDSYFTSFSKGSIDLGNYKIGKINFADEINLYSLGEKANPNNSNTYIKTGINICIKLLEGKIHFDSEEENNYVILLKQKGLIPLDLSKITKSHKGNLIRLITGLKFILPKIDSLDKMLHVASNDSYEVYNIFEKFLSNEDKKEYDSRLYDGIGPTKEFGRSFIKLIKKYNGDFHQLGDLTRLRVSSGSISGLIGKFTEFIEIAKKSESIVNIGVEDWTGHPLSIAKKDSGYRDLKAVFTLKSGNVVEFQFHYTPMLEVKSTGVNINKSIENKLRAEKSLLGNEELIEFVKYFSAIKGRKPIGIGLLEYMSGLKSDNIRDILGNENISDDGINSISGDEIYKIRRMISDESSLSKKITRLERVLFDEAWAGLVKEYLEDIMN